jgi:hypothetical protein
VFFYQSADGGRVFFDELGPPWPKHRCTDHRSIPKQISHGAISSRLADRKSTYEWQISGWNPFFISAVSRIDKFMLKIDGEFEEEQISIYIGKALNPFGDPNQITRDNIAYMKK